ncbi:NAD-dependent epimerase/dehydratase family protein [Schaalia hyovaginalis]|uniref:NAD-dependent epimerase/dehydratase family protein n=1 Tax=Schaalia hyovaginalis TaxID=29316 RepID=UPI002A7FF879|nr:NAD-dependent epimerase/dehydratase family protein [Schaalia hyovaginalis]MDY4493040.1 NAD-dependent epimerase/dehydratase family protein [Schaalia hyovaginalis]
MSARPVADSPIFARDCEGIARTDLPWERLRGARILVTGASGMIPMHLVGALAAADERHGLDLRLDLLVHSGLRARGKLGSLLEREGLRLIEGDVVTADLRGASYDRVYHGASPARPALHSTDPASTLKANALGTLNLLDQLVSAPGRFVLMSSSEVYGAQPAEGLIAEDSYGPLDPYSVRACYYEGKRIAETSVAVYSAQYGFSGLVVRFGHIYGPGMALDDGRVQADFAADVHAGRDIVLTGDGTAVRTYTYVTDAVAGLLTADLLGEAPIYNIADPQGAVTIRELADAFVAARPELDLRVRFAKGAPPKGVNVQRRLGLDPSRLLDLGWTPRVPLHEGVRRMVEALDE